MSQLPTGTVTFLFTDIEGSTRLLRQLRDVYGELLADHSRLLREALEQAGGRQIDTQGDAFFFVFRRAKDALAAAVAGQRALSRHTWPEGVEVRVRMGLHTGEPSVGGERYVGLGLHRAARICAAAHGGQVLVSDATRGVTEDELPEGVTLRDLGYHALKDFDRPQRLFQLLAPDLPSEFPSPRTGQPEPVLAGREGELVEAAETALAEPRRRRRAVVSVIAGVIAAAVAVPILALAERTGDSSVVVSANSVAVIDPNTNELVDSVAVGTAPSSVVVGEGSVWVLNGEDRTVSRIDPETMDATTIGTGTTPSDLAVGGGSVWLVTRCPHSTVFRLDPGLSRVEPVVTLRSECPSGDPRPSYVGYGAGSVWVANNREDIVWRVDPDEQAVETIPLDAKSADSGGEGIAVGEGAVWVNRADSVVRVDPGTNSTTRVDVRHEFGWIAAGEGAVWTAHNVLGPGRGAGGTLWRIDPRLDAAVTTIEVGTGPLGIGVGAGAVWVANSVDGTVSRVDPLDNEEEQTIEVGGTPRGVAVGEGAVWVTVG
ncbi:MAG: hypothetical protein ICV64_04850 [Thermoleophilia bacterium]|nr:hypothetical protein [Thermoleophilia bacterium]